MLADNRWVLKDGCLKRSPEGYMNLPADIMEAKSLKGPLVNEW